MLTSSLRRGVAATVARHMPHRPHVFCRAGMATVASESAGTGVPVAAAEPPSSRPSLEGHRHKVVVIGGGVVGCSVLYHLTKLGWTDVCLLERKVLTAGSTWHAAGGFHALNGDPTVSALQSYTIGLYKEIEEISGQSCGVKWSGGVNFACTPERWQYLRNEWAKHRTMGIDSKLMTPEECKEYMPIMDLGGKNPVIGGLFDANEGYLDCSGVTWAYAKSATKQGATIHQHTKVESLTQVNDEEAESGWGWRIETDRGTVEAEHIVNCGGLWAREVGEMAGVHLPLLPMQHHYLITEQVPEVEELRSQGKLLHAIDLDGESYTRSEGGGILCGLYEADCLPWAADGSPWEYGENELLQPDLDRIGPELERAFERYPPLNEVGIRSIVNGPFTFAPDGNPLVGPVEGTGLAQAPPQRAAAPGAASKASASDGDVHNFWAACAVMAGFSQGGGVGLSLAEWMVHGQPTSYPDIFGMDVARFGPWASRSYTLEKSQENYRRRFRISYPNEELPVARNMKVSPIHAMTEAEGAVFGVSYGLEFPKYFSVGDHDAPEVPSFERTNSFDTVAAEVATVRDAAGLLEMSGFSKYEVTGPGARQWLDHLLACRIPKPGRMTLAPMLGHNGHLMGDLTVACMPSNATGGPDRFMLYGSGYLQGFHMRWFAQQRARHTGGVDPADVHVANVTDSVGGIAVSGPRSRELMERLVLDPSAVSHDAMRFMSVARMDVGMVPATVCRVSVTGELGYEVSVDANQLPRLYASMLEAGSDLGVRPFGSYALNSLRLEKSFGIWSREYTPEFTPGQSGLSRFVAFNKAADFVGREEASKERDGGPPAKQLVTLDVHSDRTNNNDAWGYEPVWSTGGDYLGFTTSGGYGHSVGKSLAMAYIDTEVLAGAGGGDDVTVHVMGDETPATVVSCLHDPTGGRMFGPGKLN